MHTIFVRLGVLFFNLFWGERYKMYPNFVLLGALKKFKKNVFRTNDPNIQKFHLKATQQQLSFWALACDDLKRTLLNCMWKWISLTIHVALIELISDLIIHTLTYLNGSAMIFLILSPTVFEIFILKDSSYFFHNPWEILQLKYVRIGRYW